MTRPRIPRVVEDIAAQQQKIISGLRTQVKTLEEENSQLKDTMNEQQQKIEYLRESQQELNDLRAAFGNGNVTYNQAFSAIQARKNAAVEMERRRIGVRIENEDLEYI